MGLEGLFAGAFVWVFVVEVEEVVFFLGFFGDGVVQTGVGGGAGHLKDACFSTVPLRS